MATAPQPDLSALFQSFLFYAYVGSFDDPRIDTDQRQGAQLELEAFILRHGPEILLYLQRGLDVSEADPTRGVAVARWFMRFVGSRAEEWLQAVNPWTIERFWRSAPDAQTSRAAVDLMIQIEYVNDPFGGNSAGSQLVRLFREFQQEPFAIPLSNRAEGIIQGLYATVKLTPLAAIRRPTRNIAKYALQVLRHCFVHQYRVLVPEELDIVVALGGARDSRRISARPASGTLG